MAGTLQGLLTPDLNVGIPTLAFFEYVAWRTGIVTAALLLVVGMGRAPRSGSVIRVFIVVGYTVGWSMP